MNERIYGSRCHAIDVEWEGERLDGIAYTFDDCVHILSWDELMSVEVSGRSFLHDYISTPSQWPEPTAAVAPLMDARPGATEPGMGMLDLEHQDFEMRPLTGLDAAVGEHIEKDPSFASTFARIRDLLIELLPRYAAQGKTYATIAFGCTGGHHRSVFVAERIAGALRDAGFSPTVLHRNLGSRAGEMIEGSQQP